MLYSIGVPVALTLAYVVVLTGVWWLTNKVISWAERRRA